MHAFVSFVSIARQTGGALGGARLLVSLLVTPAIMWLLVAAVGMAHRGRRSPAAAGRLVDAE